MNIILKYPIILSKAPTTSVVQCVRQAYTFAVCGYYSSRIQGRGADSRLAPKHFVSDFFLHFFVRMNTLKFIKIRLNFCTENFKNYFTNIMIPAQI